ncbi:MAG: NAD(P)H-hydrate dehydratase [Acidimicrobiales bacterium]
MTPDEMAAIDEAAPEAVEVLIGRAGAAVARQALDLLGGTYGDRVVVLAGKGNNGADGRAAAERLALRGIRCRVIDAAEAPGVLPGADLVIDAAYGTGFHGEYHPPAPASPETPILAVDIPSGVDGRTGEAGGEPWAATRTVTFAALKPGLLIGDGADLAGEVVVADIGLVVSGSRTHRVTGADVAGWLPERPRSTHKWKSAVWLVAGSPGMTGAAHLATRSAQRGGAGYVRLSTPGSDTDPMAPTEAVVVPLPAEGWAGEVLDGAERFSSLAVGPGLGTGDDDAAQVRELVARSTAAIVIDGDGLKALGRQAAEVIGWRPDDAGPVVLTPHDGEYEVLTGGPPGPDRFAAARELAASTGAVVLLKGSTTIVAAPDGTTWAATAGDARLATAGTGDVLTGLLAALLAQEIRADRAAVAAAYLHGRAGDLAWRRGLVAGDLVHRLPAAFADLPGG